MEVPLTVRGVRRHGESRVASSLFTYGFQTLKIILRAYRDYWPMRFFGWLATLFLVPGAALLAFFVWHRVVAGQFSPHIWSGFTGAALLALGLLTLVTGMSADMLKRIRLNQEAILYYQKKEDYARQQRGAAR